MGTPAVSQLVTTTVGEGELWPAEFASNPALTEAALSVSDRLRDQVGRPLIEYSSSGELKVGTGLAGFVRVGDHAIYVIPKCFASSSGISLWGSTVPEYLHRCRGQLAGSVAVTGTGAFAASPRLVAWWATHYSRVLSHALSRYPYLKYVPVVRDQEFLRGRINWKGQVRELSTGGYRLVCEFNRYQVNNSLNQLLRWAAEQFLGLSPSTAVRAKLRHSLELLSEVSVRPPSRHVVNALKVPSSMASYREPVAIARALFNARYPSLASGTLPASGVVVDMQGTFEAFVDGVVYSIVKRARERGDAWTYGAQTQHVLAVPVGAGREFATVPDNTVAGSKPGVGVVIDAKYKGVVAERTGGKYLRPTSPDLYQVVSACVARGWSSAVLVSPSTVSGQQGLRSEWRVPLAYGAAATDMRVAHVTVDLSALDSPSGAEAIVDVVDDEVRRLI